MEFADVFPVEGKGKGTDVEGQLEDEVHVGDSVEIVGLRSPLSGPRPGSMTHLHREGPYHLAFADTLSALS
jgi:hypothetical protein